MATNQQSMRAVFTTGSEPYFQLQSTTIPTPAPNQALIKVHAFSLNQGETRTALNATTSYIPGWDFAGVIAKAADDGSSLPAGARVFGFIPQGSWAEYLTAPAGLMAAIPDAVTDAQAASLPVAALTAFTALEAAGNLYDRRLLVTGAAGGVGLFACQLAALAGAEVFALSSRPQLAQQLQQAGVQTATVFTTIEQATAGTMYDVIVDSVGGSTLASAIRALSPGGLCVNVGNSSREATSFNVRSSDWPFTRKTCIWLGREIPNNCSAMLTHLVNLVQLQQLHPPIHATLSWAAINEATTQLLQRTVHGKIILYID